MNHDDAPIPAPDPIPELPLGDPRRYRMNVKWVWSRQHTRGRRRTATVRATVVAEDPSELRQRLKDWVAHLHGPDNNDIFVHGGCFCQRERMNGGTLVLLFSSGGEDVADSLDYGIQWFSGAVLKPIPSSTVTWEELPLHRRPTGGENSPHETSLGDVELHELARPPGLTPR